MKIAINKCYGGFDLSHKAIEMIMKRKGLGCYKYKQTKYKFSDGVAEYTRLDDDDYESSLFIHYSTTDLGKKIEEIPNENYWYYGDLERTDEELISVIEELGEESSGSLGSVKVVEIPDDVDWEIEDYDGIESIHEKHRVWQ